MVITSLTCALLVAPALQGVVVHLTRGAWDPARFRFASVFNHWPLLEVLPTYSLLPSRSCCQTCRRFLGSYSGTWVSLRFLSLGVSLYMYGGTRYKPGSLWLSPSLLLVSPLTSAITDIQLTSRSPSTLTALGVFTVLCPLHFVKLCILLISQCRDAN